MAIDVPNGGRHAVTNVIFVALAAQQPFLWSNGTVSRATCLYIAALWVNVLNCRESGVWTAGAGVFWVLRLLGVDANDLQL